MFRYIGSKISTAEAISKLVLASGARTVADAYGGLGTVGATLKSAGLEVASCDVLNFAHAFQVARLECNEIPRFTKLRAAYDLPTKEDVRIVLNAASNHRSWLVREYSRKRLFFSPTNASRISGAWEYIADWTSAGLLSRREQAFLTASLLNSMDAVANTAGTYYAHLKQLDRKARKPFNFDWITPTKGLCSKAYLGDAHHRLSKKHFDLLYLDPPYNKRDYSAYYHLPETIAGLEEVSIAKGSKSGVPAVRNPASQNIKEGAELSYIERLISDISWNNLIVHYCDHAYIPLVELRASLRKYGRVREYKIDALGYTTKKIARKIDHHVFVIAQNGTRAA